jgi:predicted DNA-binding transcriptional regulator AlpA
MPKLLPQTLTVPEAARYIGMSTAYLKRARQLRRGPAYLRYGRTIRYRLRDLDEWVDRHVVRTRERRAS